MNNESTVTRFGVLGTGRITRRLVADIQSTEGASVIGIASRTAERARWYADQYGIAHGVQGYQSLLERDDVDAIYIALPPSMHAQWSIAAAQAGKHVLCEKPLTVSAEQSEAIDRACRDQGVRWLDATAWLHHPRTEAFGRWIAEGRFGTIGHISASVSFNQPFHSDEHRLDPALGGGCLLDLGWYVSGITRYVTGELPRRVFAHQLIGQGVSKRVTAMMWFNHDVTATLSCGFDTATRKWFEVAGSKSSLICDDFTRPWADRPPRCWIHTAAGTVEKHDFSGHQERLMVAKLIGTDSLDSLHRQSLDTQLIIDGIQRSIDANGPIDF